MIETTNKKEKLKDFQLLLEGPEKTYIDFGKIIAPNSKLIQRENDLGELIIQEDLAKKNGTIVLSKKELRQELCKYNLAIVAIKDYCGDFSIDYLKNVKEFLEEKKLAVSNYDLKNDLYVIYPKLHYRFLQKEDITESNFINYTVYMYNGKEETNPTILYKEKDFYHLVHKGKNYKTLYNLRRGLFFAHPILNGLLRLVSLILFGVLLYYIPYSYPTIKIIVFFMYLAYNAFFTFHDSRKSEMQFNNKLYTE